MPKNNVEPAEITATDGVVSANDLIGLLNSSTPELTRTERFIPPGLDTGFDVVIKFTPSKQWRKMIRQVSSRGGNEFAQNMAIEARDEKMLATAVVDWSGMTPEHFLAMLPIDEDAIPAGTTKIEYDERAIPAMIREVPEFRGWVYEQVRNLQAFRDDAKKAATKN